MFESHDMSQISCSQFSLSWDRGAAWWTLSKTFVKRKFQLQSLYYAITCTAKRVAVKNSGISCLALIVNLSNLKMKVLEAKISLRLQDMTSDTQFFPCRRIRLGHCFSLNCWKYKKKWFTQRFFQLWSSGLFPIEILWNQIQKLVLGLEAVDVLSNLVNSDMLLLTQTADFCKQSKLFMALWTSMSSDSSPAIVQDLSWVLLLQTSVLFKR